MRWWDELSSSGPALGYFPNAKECWLITKPEKEEEARAVFGETAINITTEGHKHIGAALGSRSYFEEYVGVMVEDWVSQVVKFAEFGIRVSAPGKLCGFYVRPTDVLFKNTSRHR